MQPLNGSQSPTSCQAAGASAALPQVNHWLLADGERQIHGLVQDFGVELLQIRRAGDRMTFLCARNHAAAQVAMAGLIQSQSLWAQALQTARPTFAIQSAGY